MIPDYLSPDERRRRMAQQQQTPASVPTPAADAAMRASAATKLSEESSQAAGGPPTPKDPGMVRLDVKRRRRPGSERTLADILTDIGGLPGSAVPGPMVSGAGAKAPFRL